MEQQLLSILNNENSRQQYRYLLLDALTSVSEIDFIDLNNIKEIVGEKSITTVIRPELSHDLESCPKLITLAEPNQELQQQLLHFSVVEAKSEALQSKRYVCGWMVSEHPPEVVAEQIVNIGQFIGNACGMGFSPFYEPFRLELLHESNQISHEWLAGALSCFNDYCYPTLNHSINIIQRLNYQPHSLSVFLLEESKFYHKQAKSIYHLYIAWRNISENINQPTLKNKSLVAIAGAYRQAWQQRLTTESDRFIFSLMSLRYGDLTKNKKIMMAVEAAKNEPDSLSSRFQSIDKKEFLSLITNH